MTDGLPAGLVIPPALTLPRVKTPWKTSYTKFAWFFCLDARQTGRSFATVVFVNAGAGPSRTPKRFPAQLQRRRDGTGGPSP